MILVTGAGGKTGQAIIQAVVKQGAAVRGLIRRQALDSQIKTLGAEPFVGDMLLAADVKRAAEGVTAIYHIPPNMTRHEQPMGRIVQTAAKNTGAKLVYHSVLHPQTERMPHHWNKLHVEESLFEQNIPFTILQPTAYMQNFFTYHSAIIHEGRLALPYPPETPISLVDLHDVAAVAAKVLLEDGHEGATYELVGTRPLSQTAVAQALTTHLGRTVTAKEIPLVDWEAQARVNQLTPYAIDTLSRMFDYYAQHGLIGNPNVLRWLLGREPTSLKTFIQREFV